MNTLETMPTGKASNQISVVLTQDVRSALEDFASEHHWSISKAASILIARGLGLEKTTKTKTPKAKPEE